MEKLSIRIQKMLLDKQMSKKELAEKCNWTSSNLGNKFVRNSWSWKDLQKVVNALDTPLVISITPQPMEDDEEEDRDNAELA